MIGRRRRAVRPRGEKIRIGFVIDELYLPAGGTEAQLIRLLEGLDRKRFDPQVFCLQGSDWVSNGGRPAPVHVLDMRLSRSPAVIGSLQSFSRTLRAARCDIIQTHFRDSNILGVLAGWAARVPVIISTRRGVPYWRGGLDLALLKLVNRRVTWFIANSQATRDRYVREERLDPRRVSVIYNGLEPERLQSRGPQYAREVRRGLGLPSDAAVVGIVANLRPVKGLGDFVAAAAMVRETFPNTYFLIAGAGPEEARLRGLASELGLQEHLRLLGARSDVPDLLQAFDVGVLASHSESFANAILEYLAAGLPVVVTDVGGVREVVREGQDGFIVPSRQPDLMAEKIRILLGHPDGPRAWRSGGEQLGRRFWVQTMVEQHEQLYLDLYDLHVVL